MRGLLGVFLVLLAGCVQADGVVDDSIARLSRSGFVEGDFTQHRYLKGFSRPLTATGNFSYWRQQGLYWEMQTPFFRATTYGHKDVIQWQEDGTVAKVVKTDAVQKQVSGVILAMLSADMEQLSAQFQVEARAHPRGWLMTLRPKLAPVAQMIHRIEVVGDTYLQQLELMAANGDRTVINFGDVREAPQPSADRCRRFFAAPDQSCE